MRMFGQVTPLYVGAQAPNQLFMIDVADGSTYTWSEYSYASGEGMTDRIVLVDTTMNTETTIDGTVQSDGSFLIPGGEAERA